MHKLSNSIAELLIPIPINPIAELLIPIGIPTKEAKREIEIHVIFENLK